MIQVNFWIKKKLDPRGEILLRGPAVFKGYLKDEKNTNEAIDKDGKILT